MEDQMDIFGIQNAYMYLDSMGEPLQILESKIDWKLIKNELDEAFLEVARKQNKSDSGRPRIDVLKMFKILILQTLYNLSDREIEKGLANRLDFMRFVGIPIGSKPADEKTVWKFREELIEMKVLDKVFNKFNEQLKKMNLKVKQGVMIDSTIIETPRKHNDNEKESLKQGNIPDSWNANINVKRQKDIDASWTRKKSYYFGYRAHVIADRNKLIKKVIIETAKVNDCLVLPQILGNEYKDTRTKVYADAGYDTKAVREYIENLNCIPRIPVQKRNNKPVLTSREKEFSKRTSKVRKFVEHIFANIKFRMNFYLIRTVGKLRALFKVTMACLIHNIQTSIRLTRKKAKT